MINDKCLNIFGSDIVFLNDNHTKCFTDTLLIATEIKIRHFDLVKILRRLVLKNHILSTEFIVNKYH